MSNSKRENKLLIPMVILVTVCAVLLIGLISKCGDNNSNELISQDGNAVTWNGEQDISRPMINDKPAIAIPGINELIFVANQKKQKVNFYNPEVNTCYFQMNLFVDYECLWKSANVAPGNGYYEIELYKSLPVGNKQGYLLIKCFKENERKSPTSKVVGWIARQPYG